MPQWLAGIPLCPCGAELHLSCGHSPTQGVAKLAFEPQQNHVSSPTAVCQHLAFQNLHLPVVSFQGHGWQLAAAGGTASVTLCVDHSIYWATNSVYAEAIRHCCQSRISYPPKETGDGALTNLPGMGTHATPYEEMANCMEKHCLAHSAMPPGLSNGCLRNAGGQTSEGFVLELHREMPMALLTVHP